MAPLGDIGSDGAGPSSDSEARDTKITREITHRFNGILYVFLYDSPDPRPAYFNSPLECITLRSNSESRKNIFSIPISIGNADRYRGATDKFAGCSTIWWVGSEKRAYQNEYA